jgi:predicted nucleic acid-binding protein
VKRFPDQQFPNGPIEGPFFISGSAMTKDAKPIVLVYSRLSVRHEVHLAVMQQNGIDRILTFDGGFDSFPRVARIS